jgi:hypothetical protein
MPTTRYPGVTSFLDTILAHRLFFGRKEDGNKLFYYILVENLTVLYSKSGYGKTSLLQAGVFSMLREENLYPVSVRFNKKELTPQKIIELEVLNINNQKGYEVLFNTIVKGMAEFFENLEIWSPYNKLQTPVIILDQFEELFTLEHNFQYRSSFIEELSQVLNKAKEGHISIKFVISIREDFLGHLEKLAVKIPSIFSNRFRLEALTKNAAKEAILNPSQIEIENVVFDSPKIIFQPDALEELLEFLSLKKIEGKWVETDEIEPIQLQILCSELEERAINQKKEKHVNEYIINENTVGGFEGIRSILGTFYDKQLTKVRDEKKLNKEELLAIREVIEKELISGKRRIPLAYDGLINRQNIRKDAIDLLIDHKLLKVENYQQNSLLEISHDALVEPILSFFEERRRNDEITEREGVLREEKEKAENAQYQQQLLMTAAIKKFKKVGFFLQFGNIKVLLLDINKSNHTITVEICNMIGAFKCGSPLATTTIKVGSTYTYHKNRFNFSITLLKIDKGGSNPLTPAAYILFKNEN